MLQSGLMKPHKPHPISRKVDADISDILLGPRSVRTAEISRETVLGRAFSDQADLVSSRNEIPVGPFGWISLNFVAVCALIALFSTIFIRDSFEYSRRTAHLPADDSDLKPDFHSAASPNFRLEPARLASALQFDRRQRIFKQDDASNSNQQRELGGPQNISPAQPATSLPNNNNVGVTDKSSSATSRSMSPENASSSPVSRATRSSAATTSGGAESSSSRSTVRRAIRSSRKSTVSARTASLSRRQTIRNPGAARSALHSAQQHSNTLAIRGSHQQTGMGQANAATHEDVMSMHSLGGGSAGRALHPIMNPMRMEGGLLAQPCIGAGLGGVSGNGLGGGGGGNRGGGRVAK